MKVVMIVPERSSRLINTEMMEMVDRIIVCRRTFLDYALAEEKERHRRYQASYSQGIDTCDRLKQRYGRKSGHPKLQAAESRADKLFKQVNQSQRRLDSISGAIDGLEAEREELIVMIARYGASAPIQFTPACYNVRIEKNGRLSIYFTFSDGPLRKGEPYGRVSITPDLSVYYERLAGEPRGYHNVTNSRVVE